MPRWFKLAALAVLALVAWMFTVQNDARTSDLSLDLGFWAVHLARPQSISRMLWIAFGAGFLLGGGWGLLTWWAGRRRVREMERRLARAGVQGAAADGWK